MKSYNSVTLVGRAVADCSIYKTAGNGESIGYSVFTLAIDRADKEKDGKRVTDFISVKAYGKLGTLCSDYIKKSSIILITGRIQTTSYEVDRETKWRIEVIADSMNVLEYKN